VERRPVDRPVNPGEAGLPDQVLEAHERAEEAVISKEARVVEEIGLRTETDVEHKTIHDTVRKTEVEIEDDRTGERTGRTGDRIGRDPS
jgi:stress response protein YsnF